MTTKTLETTLNDEQIIDIAQTLDQCFIDIGEKHHPAGIELASIALGRLMVFTKQLQCYATFHELLDTVVKMGSVDFDKMGEMNGVHEDSGTNE